MKRNMRTILMYLLILPLTAVLLAAGFFLPDAVFRYLDNQAQDQLFQKQVEPMDLTLSTDLNLYERMRLLALKSKIVHLGSWETTSSADSINTAALLNLDILYRYFKKEMPDVYSLDYLNSHLYTSSELNQSAVFWTAGIYIKEDDILLEMILDDEEHKIVGLQITDLSPESDTPYTDLSLRSYELRIMFENTIGGENPVWITNEDESIMQYDSKFGWYYKYEQYTLHIKDGNDYYQFVMGITNDMIMFNIPEIADMKEEMLAMQEQGVAEIYNN